MRQLVMLLPSRSLQLHAYICDQLVAWLMADLKPRLRAAWRAKAVRYNHTALRLPQEAFSLVFSRTYVSSLESGLRSPTLNKVGSLAAQIYIHPLTVLALSYLEPQNKRDANLWVESIWAELHMLLDRMELPEE